MNCAPEGRESRETRPPCPATATPARPHKSGWNDKPSEAQERSGPWESGLDRPKGDVSGSVPARFPPFVVVVFVRFAVQLGSGIFGHGRTAKPAGPPAAREPARAADRSQKRREREACRTVCTALAPRRGAALGWGGWSGGSAALHHRLISYVPPARRGGGKGCAGRGNENVQTPARRTGVRRSGLAARRAPHGLESPRSAVPDYRRSAPQS